MKIKVASAGGHGQTELSAFDSALSRLGVRDQNLIHLSSVIPIGAKVERGTVDFNNRFQGNKVYCVYAEKRTHNLGTTVAAGLGWVLTKEEPHWGLFVEHVGHTEEEIRTQIEKSLQSMTQYRSDFNWSDIQTETVSITCQTKPVCAVALAVYKHESWT